MVAALLLAPGSFGGELPSRTLVFADGLVSCRLLPNGGLEPELPLAVLPIAMNSALASIGPPDTPAEVIVQIQAAPSFLDRAFHFFQPIPTATQQDDAITVVGEKDPLKLGFRLAHELSHWLVQKKHVTKPPLWLDEGLANLAGSQTADICARVYKRNLARSPPDRLEQNLFSIEELVALQEYPPAVDRSAAFYWQAEALVAAIREKLGHGEFMNYLRLLCSPDPLDWKKPLREQWYFSDWDFQFLARQVRPSIAKGSANEP